MNAIMRMAASTDAVRDAVADAIRERSVVIARGGATRWCADGRAGDGHTLQTTALDMTGMSRIVSLSAGDLTVTVEAGARLKDLENVLADEGLRLPFDPQDIGGSTIGGVVAANASGPLRTVNGTLREHLLGATFVSGESKLIRTGGQVVKNVAGYDIHRALTGSYGSLGVLTSLSFKLQPLPASSAIVVQVSEDVAAAERTVAALLSGPTRPSMIEWRCGSGWPEPIARYLSRGGIATFAGYEGVRESVAWQSQCTAKEFDSCEVVDDESPSLYAALRQDFAERGVGAICITGAVSGSAMAALCGGVASALSFAARPAADWFSMTVGNTTESEAIRAFVVDRGGHVTIDDGSGKIAHRRAISEAASDLEQSLRRAMDPHDVFPMHPFVRRG